MFWELTWWQKLACAVQVVFSIGLGWILRNDILVFGHDKNAKATRILLVKLFLCQLGSWLFQLGLARSSPFLHAFTDRAALDSHVQTSACVLAAASGQVALGLLLWRRWTLADQATDGLAFDVILKKRRYLVFEWSYIWTTLFQNSNKVFINFIIKRIKL